MVSISNLNTDKVEDMSFMFFGCSSLEELNLSNLNNYTLIFLPKIILFV